MQDAIRSTISSGNHLRVFSVYISLLISRVRPVHSFFEKKSILENTSQITKNTSNKRDHPEKDGLFTFMRKMYYSLNLAARNSLFKRAICSTEIPLGHSISQALVLVQLPKPSSSIFATIARALLAASGRP